VIAQFPALIRVSVEPETEQISVVALEYVTAPPLDAAAVRVKLLVAISAVVTGAKVIVCGSLVTSNETL
jgi:hypothetical protein